jgi:hypothetical protein
MIPNETSALRDLQWFFGKVKELRDMQKLYFEKKGNYYLENSKRLEKEMDKILIALEKKGYKPLPPDPLPQQGKLI